MPDRRSQLIEIGERLLKAREDKGWSRKELAEESGISRESIGGYERGDEAASFFRMIQVARALEVSLDYIAGLSPHKSGLPAGKAVLDQEQLEKALSAKSRRDLPSHMRGPDLSLGFEVPEKPLVLADDDYRALVVQVREVVRDLPGDDDQPGPRKKRSK